MEFQGHVDGAAGAAGRLPDRLVRSPNQMLSRFFCAFGAPRDMPAAFYRDLAWSLVFVPSVMMVVVLVAAWHLDMTLAVFAALAAGSFAMAQVKRVLLVAALTMFWIRFAFGFVVTQRPLLLGVAAACGAAAWLLIHTAPEDLY